MSDRPRVRAGVVACVSPVLLVLGSCAGEDSTGTAHGGHDASGAAADHGGTAAEPTPPPGAEWNADDAAYLTAMIAHHRQALDMSALAPSRATSREVRALARTIDAGQGAEILAMAAWLDQRELPVPTLDELEHDHAGMTGMAGMLTPSQLTALAAADGQAFDRLYLEGMVQHHLGAVSMAEREVARGRDLRALEMATEVIAGQSAEVERMRVLLRRLP